MLTSGAGAAAAPIGGLPPLLTHSSMELKGVNFLVLPKLGLLLSWQMPESDFLTIGSALAAAGAAVVAGAAAGAGASFLASAANT